VGHEEEVGVMTVGNFSRMGRMSGGTEEREEPLVKDRQLRLLTFIPLSPFL
jgi:hypothetical protein